MTLVFDRDFAPDYGRPDQIGPGLRRITARNPGPYTFKGTNSYLVGRESVIVVDPGPDDGAHVAAVLAAIGSSPVGAILLTHSHADHMGAVPAMAAATGAPVLAAMGGDSSADRRIADRDEIPSDIGPLTVVATPGHAADHLCLALPGGRELLSGDHVMAWSTSVVTAPGGSMSDYMESLDRLIARPETVYWPGHGGPVRDGPEYCRQLRAHRLEREALILDAVRGGASALPDIVARAYPGLDPSLVGAAGQSARAHLDRLVGLGLVERRSEDRFLPIPPTA